MDEYNDKSFPTEGLEPCDLIMKGGITSGVVYPLAICELAQKRRFRNIGGTSAGAIAAAVGAAAEYGRLTGRGGQPFVELSRLPNELATKLSGLFQPSKKTEVLLAIAMAFLGEKSGLTRARQVLAALLRGHPVAGALGSIPGWVLIATSLVQHDVVAVAFGVLLAMVGSVLAAVVRAAGLAWTRTIKDNYYGLCTGMHEPGGAADALTPWLGALIDRLAGTSRPLTFGDLWKAGGPSDPKERAVNLEMMTSNITSGKPHRLPTLDGTFYFSKKEWSRLFPPDVMKAITVEERRSRENADLFEFPPPADLPVVVGVRMSLSFPGLLSAVPLYGVDHVGKREMALAHCWFSDGGLISNFPIHFFDQVWPRWPTFAFDLCSREDRKVWLPAIEENINLPGATVGSLSEFAGALIDAMQNWSDKTQSLLPGYRERIAHIGLSQSEGGLNLQMPPAVIKALAARGQEAARLFETFDWEQHRWTRFLSSMREFRDVLETMRATFRTSNANGQGLDAFLKTYPSKANAFPSPSAEWLDRARGAAQSLVAVLDDWDANEAMKTGEGPEPKPQPQLRVFPRY